MWLHRRWPLQARTHINRKCAPRLKRCHCKFYYLSSLGLSSFLIAWDGYISKKEGVFWMCDSSGLLICIQKSSHFPSSKTRWGQWTWAVPCGKKNLTAWLLDAKWFKAMMKTSSCSRAVTTHLSPTVLQYLTRSRFHSRPLLPCSFLFSFALSFFFPFLPICTHLNESLSCLYPLIINLIFWVTNKRLCRIKEASTKKKKMSVAGLKEDTTWKPFVLPL